MLAWVPGKVYYADGMAPAVLAAGSLAAERWIARARRPRLRRGIVIAAPLVGMAIILPAVLPIVPAGPPEEPGRRPEGKRRRVLRAGS